MAYSKGALLVHEKDTSTGQSKLLLTCNFSATKVVKMLCQQNGYTCEVKHHKEFLVSMIEIRPYSPVKGGIDAYGSPMVGLLLTDLQSYFGKNLAVIG